LSLTAAIDPRKNITLPDYSHRPSHVLDSANSWGIDKMDQCSILSRVAGLGAWHFDAVPTLKSTDPDDVGISVGSFLIEDSRTRCEERTWLFWYFGKNRIVCDIYPPLSLLSLRYY